MRVYSLELMLFSDSLRRRAFPPHLTRLIFPEAKREKKKMLAHWNQCCFPTLRDAVLFHLIFNSLDFPEAKKTKK